MTRRDIIIIAVIANIGVLALLFILAFRSEEEKIAEQPEIAYNFTPENPTTQPPQEVELLKSDSQDDFDSAEENPNPPVLQDEDNAQLNEPETPLVSKAEEPVKESSQETSPTTVEVTVKKGDALEKIARANGTSVEAIMKASQLKSDRLKIGQVLQVPVGSKPKPLPSVNKPAPVASNEAQYYMIKEGDNPWKIAKQFHLKVDQLLKLNNLDEETARKLKVGDRIRVQ